MILHLQGNGPSSATILFLLKGGWLARHFLSRIGEKIFSRSFCDAHKRLHHRRIELRSGAAREFGHNLVQRYGLLVGPI
jgi:hypothetical protein